MQTAIGRPTGRRSASVKPADRDLAQEQADRRGDGNRHEGTDDTQQHPADQDRDQADGRGYLNGTADDRRNDEGRILPVERGSLAALPP